MDISKMGERVAELRNRARYAAFDRQTLARIADEDLVPAIRDYLHDHVLSANGAGDARAAFDRLSPGLRAIYATQELDEQVRNGGFAQFLWNPSGRFAIEALDGLQRIGAMQRHAVVDRAIDQFVDASPGVRAQLQIRELSAFAAFAKALDYGALDSAYFQLDKTERLGPLQIAYVRAHADEFVTR
jgi:hypothetical protein